MYKGDVLANKETFLVVKGRTMVEAVAKHL